MEQVTSPEFVQLTCLFVVTSFWANFYIGTFDLQLADSELLDVQGQHEYARLFTLIMTCGAVAIPAVGALMDLAGFSVTSIVMLLQGFLWALFLLVNSATSLLVSFVLYATFRTFLFTFLFAYLADTLGFKYYGVLSGIMFAVGGFAGLFQYYLAEYASGTCHLQQEHEQGVECDRGRWSEVNTIMAATLVMTFYFSYKDWTRRCQQRMYNEGQLKRPLPGGKPPLFSNAQKDNRTEGEQGERMPLIRGGSERSGVNGKGGNLIPSYQAVTIQ